MDDAADVAGAPLAELPSGTVTFLFTDIEGSTALLRELGARYGDALAEHERLLRHAFDTCQGRVIDTQGDAFFVAFRRAKDAVAAAVAAQRALAENVWPDGCEVRVRMGIHTGEPAVGEDRYIGIAVHRAARICGAGHGGQVLVSQSTRELLREDAPNEAQLRDLGERRLKDLDDPERLYQVVAPGLRTDFPPLKAPSGPSADAVPAPGLVEFRILGPLEVVSCDEVLTPTRRMQRALLTVLLLNANQVVSIDRLIDSLWGAAPPRTASTSLQNVIAYLRKLLGAETIVTRSPGYMLRLEPGRLDAARFEELLQQSRATDAATRADLLRRALALWRGPALAEFAYDAFAEHEAGRLEELRVTARADLVETELELGRDSEVVPELEALVAQHPLHERLRGQLMVALYRSGRQAEALQAYQDARRMLTDELGIDPSPALRQLHRSILGQEPALAAAAVSVDAPTSDHYAEIVRAVVAGRLVPVLGVGASDVMRPVELAAHLARSFDCPPNLEPDLARVAQYVAVTRGIGPLYDELHAAYGEDDSPARVHRFLASLPPQLRKLGAPQQLIVTATYDRALERAFQDRDEPVDVVTYLASGRDRGKFLHVDADGAARVVEVPNAYAALVPDARPVILKIHGQVDRTELREWESFVVSEDDYIGYLAQAEIASVVPVSLAAKLRRSHFLFLGYSLLDWHVRVFLQRVWGDDKVAYRSWAVGAAPEPIEREFWRHRGVDSLEVPVEEYLDGLERRLADSEGPG